MLPVDEVMCTVELATHLDLEVEISSSRPWPDTSVSPKSARTTLWTTPQCWHASWHAPSPAPTPWTCHYPSDTHQPCHDRRSHWRQQPDAPTGTGESSASLTEFHAELYRHFDFRATRVPS